MGQLLCPRSGTEPSTKSGREHGTTCYHASFVYVQRFQRARGLQLIESIATEFSTAWRSSNISITWDFHLRAKRKFEVVGLLSARYSKCDPSEPNAEAVHAHGHLDALATVLANRRQLCSIRTFAHGFFGSKCCFQESLCLKFMRVAVVVLSWNFSPKILALRLRMRVCTVTSTNALRPPASWSDLFHNMDFIRFFAQAR